MSFLKFFMYYLLSMFIIQSLLVGFYSFKIIRQRNKFKKNLESGKIKIITMDEALEQIEQSDKKTWN